MTTKFSRKESKLRGDQPTKIANIAKIIETYWDAHISFMVPPMTLSLCSKESSFRKLSNGVLYKYFSIIPSTVVNDLCSKFYTSCNWPLIHRITFIFYLYHLGASMTGAIDLDFCLVYIELHIALRKYTLILPYPHTRLTPHDWEKVNN